MVSCNQRGCVNGNACRCNSTYVVNDVVPNVFCERCPYINKTAGHIVVKVGKCKPCGEDKKAETPVWQRSWRELL